MRTIDIRTTQNVTISYELAAVRDRIIAFILDTVIKFAAIGLIYGLMAMMEVNDEDYYFFISIMVTAPIMMISMLVMESRFNGQTIGKRVLKIKVVKLNGKQPGFYDYMLRWCFRIVDVYGTLGIAGSVLVASTDYAQRIGDMVSNTTLVKVSSSIPITLQEVLKIDDKTSYQPQYLGVRNFAEDDIVLIKQSIDRYSTYRNRAHKQALLDLTDRMSLQLGLENAPEDRMKFLKTLIKDYIVLTR